MKHKRNIMYVLAHIFNFCKVAEKKTEQIKFI